MTDPYGRILDFLDRNVPNTKSKYLMLHEITEVDEVKYYDMIAVSITISEMFTTLSHQTEGLWIINMAANFTSSNLPCQPKMIAGSLDIVKRFHKMFRLLKNCHHVDLALKYSVVLCILLLQPEYFDVAKLSHITIYKHKLGIN
jgi:hypothetical protein